MWSNERFHELAAELPQPGEGVEVLIVVRRPDGTETQAAVVRDAGVHLEQAAEVDPFPGRFGLSYPHISSAPVLQFRVTGLEATVFTDEFFRPGRAQLPGGGR